MNATMRLLLALVTIVALGLAAGVVLVSMQNTATERRLSALEDYVGGKGEQRDRENAALNARIDEAVRVGKCDLLDQLPADAPVLAPLRVKYGCGPGVQPGTQPPVVPGEPAAVEQPAPAETSAPRPSGQPNVARSSTPPPPAPATRPLPSATTTPPATPARTTATPASAPAPPTAEPSPVDRGPVTSLLCNLLSVCR